MTSSCNQPTLALLTCNGHCRNNWNSVPKQLDSVAKLLQDPALPFLHLLPGHGRRTRFADDADRQRQLLQLLEEEGYPGARQLAAAVVPR